MTINSVSPNPAINNQIQSNEVSSNTSLETNSFENYLAAETLPSIDTTKTKCKRTYGFYKYEF